MCFYLQNQSWNASNDPPPDQNSPAAPWQTCPPTWPWVICSTSGLVTLIVDIFYVLDSFCVSDLFYVSDSFYVMDLCYLSDFAIYVITCVIVVFVNYIFVIITAYNVLVFRYIFVVFVSKNREKWNKKIWSLCRVHREKHSAKCL